MRNWEWVILLKNNILLFNLLIKKLKHFAATFTGKSQRQHYSFAVSYQAYFERFILTDSLYTSLFTLIVCYAASHSYMEKEVGALAMAAIGLMLGLLFLMREATLVLAFELAPLLILAVSNGRGVPCRGAGRIWGTPVSSLSDAALDHLREVAMPGTPVVPEECRRATGSASICR